MVLNEYCRNLYNDSFFIIVISIIRIYLNVIIMWGILYEKFLSLFLFLGMIIFLIGMVKFYLDL